MEMFQANRELQQENLTYLRNWAGASERELESIKATIASFERRLERAQERVSLISRLADLVESEIRDSAGAPTGVDVTEPVSAGETQGQNPEEPQPEGLEASFRGHVKEIVE
jgi:hypothetical protein